MKLWKRISAFLFGKRLYVTTSDGCYTTIKGVRRMQYRREKLYTCHPDRTDKFVIRDETFTEFLGLWNCKGVVQTDKIVEISEEVPS